MCSDFPRYNYSDMLCYNMLQSAIKYYNMHECMYLCMRWGLSPKSHESACIVVVSVAILRLLSSLGPKGSYSW